MRRGILVVLGGLGLVAANHALARPPAGPSESALAEFYSVTKPYELTGTTGSLDAAVLYSHTTETGSRFNPGTGGDPLGVGVQQDVTFDDIPIPNARLAGLTSVDITKITVGIRRAGTAPATDINLFFATATTIVTPPDTELDLPYSPVGTVSLLPRSTTSFITELVTFGNGTDTLFNVPLNTTILPGFGTFMLGLQFSNADNLNGWRLTSGPDTNANVMWIHDTDLTDPEGSFNFGAPPNPAASFYIVIEGNPVPEPASLSLLCVIGLLAARRRRSLDSTLSV